MGGQPAGRARLVSRVVAPGLVGLALTALVVVATVAHLSQPLALDQMAPQQYYPDMQQDQPQLASASQLQQQLRKFNGAPTQQLPVMLRPASHPTPQLAIPRIGGSRLLLGRDRGQGWTWVP